MGRVLIAGTAALLICIFLSPKFIEFLRTREFGQNIREEGPEGHHTKAGTPTMGGIIIFAAIAIPFLILSSYDWRSVGVFGAAVLSAVLGFADDYTKIIRRRSLGLRGRTKLLVTVAISLGLWWVATKRVGLEGNLKLWVVDGRIDLGPFYPVLIYLVVAGTTNAVNLTDGLDGLAIVPVMIAAATFGFISYLVGNVLFADYLQIHFVPGTGELAIVCGALVGAGLGFLWFNAPPALIFMGDTGSLALGGALGTIAVATKHELVLAIVGGLFVLEAASVIVQVTSFQLFGVRVFRMAPLHHHFEQKGWPESTVVIRFWIIAVVLALAGLATLKLR
jgi:phospho-N-acetylmuramoyl-pentapeptide-transferase